MVQWKYLTHSNIVPFLGIIDQPLQFVSVLVPRRSVTAYITSSPNTVDPISLVRAPFPAFLRLPGTYPPKLVGIASGLDYLHSRNVAHGDLGGVRNWTKAFTHYLTPKIAKHHCR